MLSWAGLPREPQKITNKLVVYADVYVYNVIYPD